MTERGPMSVAEACELLRGSRAFIEGEGEVRSEGTVTKSLNTASCPTDLSSCAINLATPRFFYPFVTSGVAEFFRMVTDTADTRLPLRLVV